MGVSYKRLAHVRQTAAQLKILDSETLLAERVQAVAKGARVNALRPEQRETIRGRIAALGIGTVAERFSVDVAALERIAAPPRQRKANAASKR